MLGYLTPESTLTMKSLIWISFACLALLWSGMAWLAGSGLQWVSGLLASGGTVDLAGAVASWSLPTWLVVWLDLGWLQSMQLFFVDVIDSLRDAWPGIGQALGWLVPLVWIGWGMGLAVLLLLALLLHWLVGRAGRPAPVPGAPAQAT
jgi:hypothetical protein